MPDQYDAFFNPKNASEKNAENVTFAIYWSTCKTYEFSRHRFCLALNLTTMATTYIPTVQASDGALRSVKHKRLNVFTPVRGYRMTEIQE